MITDKYNGLCHNTDFGYDCYNKISLQYQPYTIYMFDFKKNKR